MAPEEAFEDLYENAPCGYLSMHADGRIFRVNKTLASWLGHEKDALIGQRFRDLLTLPGRILYETQLAPLLQTATPFEEVIADFATTTGEKIAVIMNGVQRRDPGSGEVYSRLTLMRVRDRRRYERDLIASRDAAEAQNELSHAREIAAGDLLADAREASALREQFIAVLGHDLRNPLASVVGAARLLRKQPQSEKSLLFIGLMETSVQRMADLIDNVLDFARGRLGGGLTVSREDKGLLEPIIQQVVEELRSSVPERVIEVDVVLAEPADFDPVRIGQLISNLLGNALTHGDPTTPVRVGGRMDVAAFEIWVANGGQPIPQKAMDRLFQPFFRGEVRASQQGLGLGLYIASEIAKAHGGELRVSSDQAETRFTLRVPRH